MSTQKYSLFGSSEVNPSLYASTEDCIFGDHTQEPITAEIESSVDSIFKFAREHMTPMEEEEEEKVVKRAEEETEEAENEL